MLEPILKQKRVELAQAKERVPISQLEERIPDRPPPSFRKAIARDQANIIAEIKFRSPSHGPFAIQWPVEQIGEVYVSNGAVAISVLTDREFFGGDPEFLKGLREKFQDLPLLRKDFILGRYQVLESLVMGASACLLIAACLEPDRLRELVSYSAELGMDSLVEVHSLSELETAIGAGARIIGVNNRDLRSFQVNIETSFRIARELEGESGFALVSESGIKEFLQIQELRDAGFDAFLVGSSLMDASDPGRVLLELQGRAADHPESGAQ